MFCWLVFIEVLDFIFIHYTCKLLISVRNRLKYEDAGSAMPQERGNNVATSGGTRRHCADCQSVLCDLRHWALPSRHDGQGSCCFYKLFFVFNLEFPVDIGDVWTMLREGIYGITTPYGIVTPSERSAGAGGKKAEWTFTSGGQACWLGGYTTSTGTNYSSSVTKYFYSVTSRHW